MGPDGKGRHRGLGHHWGTGPLLFLLYPWRSGVLRFQGEEGKCVRKTGRKGTGPREVVESTSRSVDFF